MKLTKVKITKAMLNCLDEREKVLFVQLANMLNEVYILNRMVLLSFKTNSNGTEVEEWAQHSQSLFFLEILAGKLFEGWELLKRDYFTARLSREYKESLTIVGSDALEELKRYFSNSNIITKVSNQHAFHFSEQASEGIIKQIVKIEEHEDNAVYLSEMLGNCFFYWPDRVMTSIMLDDINPDDHAKAIDLFVGDTLSIARKYIDFINDVLFIIVSKMDYDADEIFIPDPPELDSIMIPYFVRHEEQ